MIDDLVKQRISEMEGLSDEALRKTEFFSLALYLQELNKIKEFCEYEIGDDQSE